MRTRAAWLAPTCFASMKVTAHLTVSAACMQHVCEGVSWGRGLRGPRLACDGSTYMYENCSVRIWRRAGPERSRSGGGAARLRPHGRAWSPGRCAGALALMRTHPESRARVTHLPHTHEKDTQHHPTLPAHPAGPLRAFMRTIPPVQEHRMGDAAPANGDYDYGSDGAWAPSPCGYDCDYSDVADGSGARGVHCAACCLFVRASAAGNRWR